MFPLTLRSKLLKTRFSRYAAFLACLTGILAAAVDGQTLVSAPNAFNFGQLPANPGSGKAQTLGYSFTGSSAPSFSLHYGLEYSISASSCSGSGTISCSVTLTFSPRYPGLRQDALLVKSASGTLLAITYLSGTGLGPQALIFPGVILTITGTGAWGYSGDGGVASFAVLRSPQSVAIDNFGNIFIADSINQVVREINALSGLISTVAGSPNFAGYTGDGALATQAHLNNPAGLAIDSAGNLFIADQGNNAVRRVDAVTEVITTVAGGGLSPSGVDGMGDGGAGTSALLNGPTDVAVDASGNLFIADAYHGLIRRVDGASGVITVVAGGGTAAGTDGLGDGGSATQAQLHNPEAIALDTAGNLFIADAQDSLVRRVDATTKIITAVVGSGANGYSGDLGPALQARLGTPSAIRVDPAGNLYIADSAQNVIRQVNAASGLITTVAGLGAARYTGDGGAPTGATLSAPNGLAIDSAGNILIADLGNNAIRKITLQPGNINFPTTFVGQASPAQTLYITNNGNQNLTFSSLAKTGYFSQQITGVADCTGTTVVTTAASCTAAIQFVPATIGTVAGTLTLKSNSLNLTATQVFTFAGAGATGSVPRLSLSTASVGFGTQAAGTASATQTITLSNPGTAPLNIAGMAFTGSNTAEFALSTTCASVIAAGANCSISAVFKPASAGSKTAVLSFVANVASPPQLLLSGTASGQPNAALSVASLAFGSHAVGAAVASKTVTLSNTGSGALAISSATVSGGNAADFTLTNSCAATLAAGASCSLSVAFNPHALGLRTATLNINDNYGSGAQTISLAGVGSAQTTLGVWRPSNGTWYITPTVTSSPAPTLWGMAGDIPVPADYDGDGHVDIAVFRPSNGTWWIIPSKTKQPYLAQWGLPGDIPVPADYDGDGKADLAIFRPSNGSWWIIPSATGVAYTLTWGMTGDKPIAGDFDGDGKADLAVFRPSNGTWWIIPSKTKQPYLAQWGLPGDTPVAADYDGDGKFDIAVFRPSNGSWWIVPSATGTAYALNWGLPGDIPITGDFDGDGKADISIWRPATATWWVTPSSGAKFVVGMGLPADIPLSSTPR